MKFNFFKNWSNFEKIWLFLSILIITTTSMILKDSPLALFSGLCGIISVILCAKGSILNYLFGMLQALTYCYLCYKAKIFGEVMYNLLMIPMIIIGIISWKKNMNEDTVKTRKLNSKGYIILILCIIISSIVYCQILKNIGGNFAFFDAISTVLSVIATILMITRYQEQWILWILVNVASIILWLNAFLNNDSNAMTMIIMWSSYLFNSIYGYIKWKEFQQ